MITTKKIDIKIKNLAENESIGSEVYLSKGVYCYYTSDDKGVSLEQAVDSLVKEKAIFLLENEDALYIVFSQNLQDTVLFKDQDENKLLSVLKLAMMQSQARKIYAVLHEDSKIIKNLSIPYDVIEQEAFKQALKKTPKLQTLLTQLTKAIIFGVVILSLCVAQSFLFDYLREQSSNEYRIEKDKIIKEVENTKKEHKKFETMINELPTQTANSYKEIVDELSGVQK